MTFKWCELLPVRQQEPCEAKEHQRRPTLEWNKGFSSELREKTREDHLMDQTRCPKCGKRMVPVVTVSGRTDLQCISCDDPAVKWAESPITAPEKPIVPEAA
jgi:hypothetical protein